MSERASPDEIKHAFRSKAKELHPDTNRSQGAIEEFIQLGVAYRVLRDVEQRRAFDDFRSLKAIAARPAPSVFRRGSFLAVSLLAGVIGVAAFAQVYAGGFKSPAFAAWLARVQVAEASPQSAAAAPQPAVLPADVRQQDVVDAAVAPAAADTPLTPAIAPDLDRANSAPAVEPAAPPQAAAAVALPVATNAPAPVRSHSAMRTRVEPRRALYRSRHGLAFRSRMWLSSVRRQVPFRRRVMRR